MFGLGMGEILVILFVALIFIGPKKLPELAKGMGKGIREFQNAAKGLTDTIKNPVQNETYSYAAQEPVKPIIEESKDETPKTEQNSPKVAVAETKATKTKES